MPLQNVEYGRVGGGCLARPATAEVFLALDRSLYKQGQRVAGRVEVTVEPGKAGLQGILLLLVQEMIFTYNPGKDDECRKKEVLVVGVSEKEETIGPGEKKMFDDMFLMIEKNLPISGFPHCEFIDVGYFVHAVGRAGKLNDDIVAKLPIVIQYGAESEWDEEEKLRVLADRDVFDEEFEEDDNKEEEQETNSEI